MNQIRNQISKRQEANLELASILKGTNWNQLGIQLESLAKEFSQQRAGQIICNYICPDYHDPIVSVETKDIMDFLFPDNPDSFFEESVVTLKRVKSYFK